MIAITTAIAITSASVAVRRRRQRLAAITRGALIDAPDVYAAGGNTAVSLLSGCYAA
jgi:hypothetical protein